MILNRKGRNTLAWSQHPFPTNHPLFMEKQCNWIRTIPKFTPYYRMTQILTEFSIHNHNIQSHPSWHMFDFRWFRNQRAGRKQRPDGRSTLVCTWHPPPKEKPLFKIKKKAEVTPIWSYINNQINNNHHIHIFPTSCFQAMSLKPSKAVIIFTFVKKIKSKCNKLWKIVQFKLFKQQIFLI